MADQLTTQQSSDLRTLFYTATGITLAAPEANTQEGWIIALLGIDKAPLSRMAHNARVAEDNRKNGVPNSTVNKVNILTGLPQ